MRVRFLGSGDALGSGGRFQTCIHVQAAGAQVLLDCGASSLVAMRRFGVDPQAIDAVVLSHLHGDHFGGVPFLILDAQFKRRTRPLTVAGPPGVEARVRATMRSEEHTSELQSPCNLVCRLLLEKKKKKLIKEYRLYRYDLLSRTSRGGVK